MQWIKRQPGIFLTSISLLIGIGLWLGRLDARQDSLSRQVQTKVDRDQVIRELDQVHEQLSKIDRRLDGLIIRQAIIAEEYSAAQK